MWVQSRKTHQLPALAEGDHFLLIMNCAIYLRKQRKGHRQKGKLPCSIFIKDYHLNFILWRMKIQAPASIWPQIRAREILKQFPSHKFSPGRALGGGNTRESAYFYEINTFKRNFITLKALRTSEPALPQPNPLARWMGKKFSYRLSLTILYVKSRTDLTLISLYRTHEKKNFFFSYRCFLWEMARKKSAFAFPRLGE